ncbi:hypothetical protein EDD15DRAFT_385470 [Pisolithus albus]|nr:hypothetical protein EDD15DRAFT_385470 [Pisolithus albus]
MQHRCQRLIRGIVLWSLSFGVNPGQLDLPFDVGQLMESVADIISGILFMVLVHRVFHETSPGVIGREISFRPDTPHDATDRILMCWAWNIPSHEYSLFESRSRSSNTQCSS